MPFLDAGRVYYICANAYEISSEASWPLLDAVCKDAPPCSGMQVS